MGGIQFHEGEVAMQSRVGVREKAEELKQMVQPQLKPGQAEFIESLSEAFVGSVDEGGRVWASAVFGRPGFMAAASPRAVAAGSGVHPWDPLRKNAQREGAQLGFLFIELATRRRNRMNGVSVPSKAAGPAGLHVAVREAFGNCPKYIQRRIISDVDQELINRSEDADEELFRRRPSPSPSLSMSQQDLVERADFFTIASEASRGRGADVSHRGGRPGFVRVTSSKELWFPDYRGNNLFQTLGNLMTNPQCGLLFIDWQNGSTLQVTGRGTVIFPDELRELGLSDEFEEVNCVVRFTIDAALHTPRAVPFRYRFIDYSPSSPDVKDSQKLRGGRKEGGGKPSAGERVEVVKVVEVRHVARGVKDFRLRVSGEVRCIPGQFATFRLDLPRGGEMMAERQSRSWTVSAGPFPDAGNEFHITVKHQPGGRASTWLHEQVREGSELSFSGIDGTFTCFPETAKYPTGKLLFLSAGIGITPMLAMLRGLRKLPSPSPSPLGDATSSPSSHQPPLDVVFFHSARSPEDVPFLEELSSAYEPRAGLRVRFVTNFSQSAPERAPALTDHALAGGRLSAAMLSAHVADVAERHVYLCGPSAYMSAAERALAALGVRAAAVHTEAFYF